MSDDKPLKSSYDLAMERLRKGDEEAGVAFRFLSDAQKTAISEVRNFYQAKLVEREILHQSILRKTLDPAERETLEVNYRRDRERLSSERDAKIDKIRNESPS